MARSAPPTRNMRGNKGNQGAEMRGMQETRATATRATGANGRGGHEHRTAKVVELIGVSSKSFEAAIRNAVTDASETTRGITGAHVQDMTVKVDEKGKITEYKVNLKVAFGIERTRAP